MRNVSAPFQQLGADAIMSLFADPRVGGVIADVLRSPEDMTSGLFSSMEPFERRETERQTSGLRSIFGTLGGRFGSGVLRGETELRGELANQFGRARQEALLKANELRSRSLIDILSAADARARLAALPFQFLPQYFAPGAPQFREGILPSLLSTGGTIAALLASGGAAAPAVAASQTVKRTPGLRPG